MLNSSKAQNQDRPLSFRGGVALVCSLLVAPPFVPAAFAEPRGLVPIEGRVDIEQDGTHTELTTFDETTRAGFEGGFDIEREESVWVQQPTVDSKFFAEDWSGNSTKIDGALGSNGVVGVINPFGVFIGNHALIDVAGLVAAGGQLDESALAAGQYKFAKLTGAVEVAEGARIEAKESVFLVGSSVANYGHIRAPGGTVVLAAGDALVLAEVDGRVYVRADGRVNEPGDYAVRQEGQIHAAGGYVSLTAGDGYSLAMNHTGITRGRDVEIDGGSTGLVHVSGLVDASDASRGANGGNISVEGELIDIEGSLDASGDKGGGVIRVGGDVRGEGPLANARRTYVGEGAILRADALSKGDGGTVVVFSEERTSFQGEISAVGTGRGGDGGFAEISGSALAFDGRVKLGSERGRKGTLLFDPVDIRIDGNGAGSVTEELDSANQVLFNDEPSNGEPFVITEATLENAIDGDIILEATNSIHASPTSNFDLGDVALQPGMSLTLRTRNSPEDEAAGAETPGIHIDGGDGALEFRTTNVKGEDDLAAANITLETGTGGSSGVADISFGRLVADGGTVNLSTEDGSISGDTVVARGLFGFNGEDADVAVLIEVGTGDVTIAAEIVAEHDAADVEDAGVSGPVRIAIEEQGNVDIARIRTEGGPRSLATNISRGVEIDVRSGDILVGEIDTSGLDGEDIDAARENPLDPASPLVRDTRRVGFGGTVTVTASTGNVTIGTITARGGNAYALAAGTEIPGNVDAIDPSTRVNGDGGNGGSISITAQGDGLVGGTGHVDVGTGGAVDTSGGDGSLAEIDVEGFEDTNGADGLAGRGGDGGSVQIVGVASVRVDGPVTTSGGDSVATQDLNVDIASDPDQLLVSETNFFIAEVTAVGGTGGTVVVVGGSAADADIPGSEANPVEVFGDVTSKGGEGRGRVVVDDPAQLDTDLKLGVSGGGGGSVQISSNGELRVGQVDDPILVQASGGDSEFGNAGSATRFQESIVVGRTAASELGALSTGDLTVYGQLVANGGRGEDGGAGGVVVVRAVNSDVMHLDATGNTTPSPDLVTLGLDELAATLVADGGDSVHAGSNTESSYVVELLRGDENFVFEDEGGNGGNIEVLGDGLTEIGAASVRGGNSEQGIGGNGGSIIITSVSGNVTNRGLLDASGGDGATAPGLVLEVNPETFVDFAERQADPDFDRDLDIGPSQYVEVVHEIVGGGNGGVINANAILGSMSLLGGSVAAAGQGVHPDVDDGVAGILNVFAGGDVLVDLIGDIGIVSVTQLDRTADSTLNTATGGTFHVTGGETFQTVDDFNTPDGGAALSYTLQVPADETLASEGGREESEDPVLEIQLAAAGVGDVVGSVSLENAAHAIVNRNGDIIGAEGTEGMTHLNLSGPLRLEGRNIGEAVDDRIGVDGSGGELRLFAGDTTDNLDGDIYVEALDASGGLDGIAIEQHEYNATTDIALPGGEQILITPVAGEMVVTQLNTESYGASVSYALRNLTSVDQPAGNLLVEAGSTALGGDLLFDVQGAIQLEPGAIFANRQRVGLMSEGPIGPTPGAETQATIDDPSGVFVFAADGVNSLGDSDVALVVTSDDTVAVNALVQDADFSLEVRGTPGLTGDLFVTEVEPDIGLLRPIDGGVDAGGDVVLRTANDADITLGQSGVNGPITVSSGGSITLGSGRVLIDNTRLVAQTDEILDMAGEVIGAQGTAIPVNDASLAAARGVELEGTVDTAATAVVATETIYASLDIAGQGITTFRGDVGVTIPLSRLEVRDLDIGTPSPNDTRQFFVGEASFLGRIDGSGTAVFETVPSAIDSNTADGESLLFAGNVGGRTQLMGFQADAPLVIFTGTESVKTGAGGIRLNVNQDLGGEIPTLATVGDRSGNLTLESEGPIRVGAVDQHHKLTTVGTLRMKSDVEVTVGDVNAHKIVIESPLIQMTQRRPADIAVDVDADGNVILAPDQDAGVDWVANQINTSSPILPVGTPGPNLPRLVIGTGGVRTPSNFDQFEVVRLDDDFGAVTPGRLLASDDTTLLDLTGNGPSVLGNPTSEIQREQAPVVPFVETRTDGASPAAPPSASAAEVLALLNCDVEDCPNAKARRGPLSTPRAAEVARVYRERVTSRDGRVRLRATFTVAGRAYRERGARVLDGPDFYDFLSATDLYEDARGEIDTLAGLLVQVDLLGLSPEDTETVQREIATHFAGATALRGFDVAAVLAAVDASPIGLVE